MHCATIVQDESGLPKYLVGRIPPLRISSEFEDLGDHFIHGTVILGISL